MMKYLLAAAAATAMVASAAAQTMDDTDNNNKDNMEYWYECSVTKVSPPDGDRDPGYKVNLYFYANGKHLFKRVIHTTRSGAQYSRGEQYKVNDGVNTINDNGANVWLAESVKYPGVYMVGTFGWLKDGKAVYIEDLYRGKNAKKPAMTINSVCHQV